MKLMKSFVLLITVLIVATTAARSQADSDNQSPDGTKTVILNVKGITCARDLKMIVASVKKLNGVSACTYEHPGTTTSFEVQFDPALVSEKEINKAIQNTGSCEDPDERPYRIKQ